MIKIFVFIMLSLSVLFAHDGHTHNAPWEACENIKLSDDCSYENKNEDLFVGTCQEFSKKLMCVRNKPIIKKVVSTEKNLKN